MTKISKIMIALAASTFSVSAQAAVEFVPPSDPVGQVFTTNANDAYNTGRGVVFIPTAAFALTSVGLFQNLTNITLNYTLALAPNATGNVGGGAVLRSGSAAFTTMGLEFAEFAVAPLTLAAGTAYHLNFSFSGNSNQNFFFDQRGAQPYSQAGFSGIDGTQNNNTANFVLPRIQLNGNVAAVPEPASWALMIVGFGLVGGAVRARHNRTLATA